MKSREHRCNLQNQLPEGGREGLITYFERMNKEYPVKEVRFVRAVAEDNFVALHTHQTWPNQEEYIPMDFFRFDDSGKIIEHWDTIQQIPEHSKNDNTMY